MEPVYTREQLEKAWFKYSQNVDKEQGKFKETYAKTEEEAKESVKYLLSLVE